MPLLDGPVRPRDVGLVNNLSNGSYNHVDAEDGQAHQTAGVNHNFYSNDRRRQRIVVVGLGMVGIAFMYDHSPQFGQLNRQTSLSDGTDLTGLQQRESY